eukprot:6155958-Amphidinium_carterae.1
MVPSVVKVRATSGILQEQRWILDHLVLCVWFGCAIATEAAIPELTLQRNNFHANQRNVAAKVRSANPKNRKHIKVLVWELIRKYAMSEIPHQNSIPALDE